MSMNTNIRQAIARFEDASFDVAAKLAEYEQAKDKATMARQDLLDVIEAETGVQP